MTECLKVQFHTGLVDYILPPEKIIEQLTNILKKEIFLSPIKLKLSQKVQQITLTQINNLLLSKTGHDFSHYKANTILRRLDRRMAMNQINNLTDYINFLKISNSEITVTFQRYINWSNKFF